MQSDRQLDVATVAALLPIAAVAAVDPAGWYPFAVVKWTAVAVVGLVAVGLTAWSGDVRVPRRAGLVGGVLLVLTAASAVVGADARFAWTGTPERHLGVFAWLLFATCFVVGAQLRSHAAIVRVAQGATTAALVLGAWCVVEVVTGPPIDLALDTSRLLGPFGSAAYLGAACCLVLPVAAGVALDGRLARRWRAVAAVAAVTTAIGLVGSGTRGALVGTAVALAVVAVVRRPHVSRRTALSLVGLGVVVGAVALPRLGDVLDRTSPPSSRIDEWVLAADVIGDAPLLGTGPEGYRIAVGEAVTPAYERRYGREVRPDRAHSAPLDVAAASGIPAAIADVVLLGLVVAAAVRSVRRDDPAVAGMSVGLIAYTAQQLVLFPVAELDPVFWLLAGVIVARTATATLRVPRSAGRAVAGFAGAATVAVLVAGVAGIAADRLAHDAARANDADAAVDAARRAVDLRPDVVRYHLLLADALARRGTVADLDAALDAVADARTWSPGDPYVRVEAAQLRSRRFVVTGADADATAAVDAWRDVVDDDPNCSTCRLGLGLALADAGATRAARVELEIAADLAPDGDVGARDVLAQLGTTVDDSAETVDERVGDE